MIKYICDNFEMICMRFMMFITAFCLVPAASIMVLIILVDAVKKMWGAS